MYTPTLDHTELRPEGGRCTPYMLCAECYGQLSRLRAEADLKQWLRAFGTLPDPGAPSR